MQLSLFLCLRCASTSATATPSCCPCCSWCSTPPWGRGSWPGWCVTRRRRVVTRGESVAMITFSKVFISGGVWLFIWLCIGSLTTRGFQLCFKLKSFFLILYCSTYKLFYPVCPRSPAFKLPVSKENIYLETFVSTIHTRLYSGRENVNT